MKHAGTVLGVLLMIATNAHAEPAAKVPVVYHTRDTDRHGWIVPDYGKLQTGGYAGLATVGLGYAVFSDVVNIGIDYGYVPESHAGRTVHTVTASLGVRPLDVRLGRIRVLPGYLWGGLLFTSGDGYFFSPGEQYSAGYYKPTAMHAAYGIGVEVDWLPPPTSWFERHGVYWEARVFGPYFVTYLENREHLKLTDVVVSTLGYRAAW